MMKEHLFPTIIYVKDLPNANELNPYLEKQILITQQKNHWALTLSSQLSKLFILLRILNYRKVKLKKVIGLSAIAGIR